MIVRRVSRIDEAIAELEGGQSSVPIVKAGEVHEKGVARVPAIARFVRQQPFGGESRVSDQPHDSTACRVGRVDRQIAFEARGHSDGARRGNPGKMMGRDVPGKAAAGLHFESAEIVVLEFGAQRDARPGRQPDLVLHEPGGELIVGRRRLEHEDAFAVVAIVRHAIVAAPRDLMTLRRPRSLLHVDVDRIEGVAKARVVTIGAVVVRAHLKVRVARCAACPVRQHVAAIDGDLVALRRPSRGHTH